MGYTAVAPLPDAPAPPGMSDVETSAYETAQSVKDAIEEHASALRERDEIGDELEGIAEVEYADHEDPPDAFEPLDLGLHEDGEVDVSETGSDDSGDIGGLF